MGGVPPKPLSLVTGHLTKEQKALREKGEKGLTAKAQMRKSAEVRENKVASAHFNRLKALYGEINMCDALCENTINRYCLMQAKLSEMAELAEGMQQTMDGLKAERGDMEASDYYKLLSKMAKDIISIERASSKLRDQLLAIERENLLTIQGKLRAVPKQPEKERQKSGFASYREKYGGKI